MRFEIVTLFPELFDAVQAGLLGKAQTRERELTRTPSSADFACRIFSVR